MLLIWGFKAISKTLAEGMFFCPREGGDRSYRHRKARRFFTLFFIPIIPLNELGDYVECSSCKSTFYPSVLEAKTASQIEDVMTIALRHLVVAMITADGQIDEAERSMGLAMLQRHANHPYEMANLDADIAALANADLIDQLEELGSILNEHGKEAILTACIELAASDGSIDESELDVARQAGAAMTMSGSHVRGVIDATRERLNVG